jgi:hypothetical protein
MFHGFIKTLKHKNIKTKFWLKKERPFDFGPMAIGPPLRE